MSEEYILSLDVQDIAQWLLVVKAQRIKDKIDLIETLSLLILPDSRKHANKINARLEKYEKEYNDILGITEIKRDKDIQKTDALLNSLFKKEG